MNVITSTPAATRSAPRTTRPRRAKLLIAGASAAVLVIAGGVTATVMVHDGGHSSTRPSPVTVAQLQQAGVAKADRLQAEVDARAAGDNGVATRLEQAGVAKADRLQAEVDARAGGSDDVMAQIHQVTGESAATQVARTRLYQELRNR